MRKVSIREFRANMSKELKDLPFALTRSGEVIAEMCTPSKVKCVHKVLPIRKSVHNQPESASESVHNPEPDPYFKPHTKEQQTRKKAK